MHSFSLFFRNDNTSYTLTPSHRKGIFVIEWFTGNEEYQGTLTSSEINLDTLTRLIKDGWDYQLITISSLISLEPSQAFRISRWIMRYPVWFEDEDETPF